MRLSCPCSGSSLFSKKANRVISASIKVTNLTHLKQCRTTEPVNGVSSANKCVILLKTVPGLADVRSVPAFFFFFRVPALSVSDQPAAVRHSRTSHSMSLQNGIKTARSLRLSNLGLRFSRFFCILFAISRTLSPSIARARNLDALGLSTASIVMPEETYHIFAIRRMLSVFLLQHAANGLRLAVTTASGL